MMTFYFTNKRKDMNMKARFKHDGRAIDFFPATDVPAGSVIVQGNLTGITKLDIPAGRPGTLHVTGVYEVVKATNVTFPLGGRVYWDEAAKQAVPEASGNAQLGIAVLDAAANDATVLVRIG
jgi:predicted RecA/RadA family phage recombinase